MKERDVMMVTELDHPTACAWLDRNSCGRTERSYSSQKNGKSHWVAWCISGVFERGSQLCERVWRLTWIGLVLAESLLESQDDSRLRYFWVGCWQLSPCFWTDHITSSWPICSWLSKAVLRHSDSLVWDSTKNRLELLQVHGNVLDGGRNDFL